MKTCKMLLSVMMISFLIQDGFCYELYIYGPSKCQTSPTPYFHPFASINASFLMESSSIHENDRFTCEITIEQDGNSQHAYTGEIETDHVYNIPINALLLNNFKFNKLARLKFFFRSTSPPYLNYFTAYGYFLVYKSTPEEEYNSITNGNVQLVFEGIMILMNGDGCSCAASGPYFVRRYKKTFDLYDNFENYIPEVVPDLCCGNSAANPGNQTRWAYKTIQTSTHAQFISFTHELIDMLGQNIGFCPIAPSHATVVYRKITRPVIASLVQGTNPITIYSPQSVIYSNLLQGNAIQEYEWRDTNATPNFSFVPNGSTATVHYNFNMTHQGENMAPYYQICLRIRNGFGWSNWKKIPILVSSTIPLCPQICYQKDGLTFFENSILPLSNQSNGKFVTDNYILMNPELPNEDFIKFSLKELEDDTTNLDMAQMIKVNVNQNESFAVTAGGEIISYSTTSHIGKVFCSKDNIDITEKLISRDNSIEKLLSGDRIKINFQTDGGGYVVMTAGNPIEKDNIAGVITSSDGFADSFYVRPYAGRICISLRGKSSGEIVLKCLTDFDLDEAIVVNNSGNVNSKVLQCKSAMLNKSQVTHILNEKDNQFIEFTKNDNMNFVFENNRDETGNSGYILKTVGNYRKPNVVGPEIQSRLTDAQYKDRLIGNLPNPFNPITKISFEISTAGLIELTVFDISGREIKKLVNGFKQAGQHEVIFNGTDFASGVYFYKLKRDDFVEIRRMMLIK